MIINIQHLISLLPMIVIGLTIIIIMLQISWQRSNFISATLTIIGLSISLLSLWFTWQNDAQNVTLLMYIDKVSVFYTGLLLISSIATSILAFTWLKNYVGNCDEFYLLVLIAVSGGILTINANHMAALFLGIELISLPLFGMIGYNCNNNYSLEASIKYTLLSSVASSFLLFGMALLYSCIGKLSFTEITNIINNGTILNQSIAIIGIGMMTVSISFKLSLVPFHLWTPDVYQGAPASVSMFLATASKITIFVMVMRLLSLISVVDNKISQILLSIISCCSIMFGNLMALNQNNIKRILGYSSIANFGYLLIGLIAIQDNTLATEAIGIYLTGYLFANLGAFGVISLMSNPNNKEDTSSLFSYRGLFWHKPILSTILTIMMLSLAGIPMTLGFIGKFYIITLGINNQLWFITSIIILGSAISLFYYLRIIISLYLSPPKNLLNKFPSRNWGITVGGIVLLTSSLFILLLGVYPQPLIDLVRLAQPML